MKPITGTHPMARELCAALGLDASLTSGITIGVYPNQAVTAEITIYLTEQQTGQIVEIVRRYKATLVEDAE